MRVEMPPPVPEHRVPSLAATDRLVGLPALRLGDAAHRRHATTPTSVRVGLRGGALCVRFDGRDAGVVATLHRCGTIRSGPRTSSRSSSPPRIRPASTTSSRSIRSARCSTRGSSPPTLSRSSMRVDATWDCPGLEARVTCRPDRWSALLTIPLEPLVRTRRRRGSAGQLLPDRPRRRFGPDEFTAWSPTFAEPAGLPRPGALRDPPPTSSGISPARSPAPCSHSTARSRARRSLNWKKWVSSFGWAQQRRAVGRRPGSGDSSALAQVPAAVLVLAVRREVHEVAARPLSLVLGQRAVARVRGELGVARGVAHEDLDDVAGLAVEEVRDLLGAVLEGHDQALPVDREGHKPDMIRVSGGS